MIATALQGFEEFERFEVPFALQTDGPGGAIKIALPRGELVPALDGYDIRWTRASLAQVRAVRLHWKTYGGHTAFEWTPPPFDDPPTWWLYDSAPTFGGTDPYSINVRLFPFRY